MQEEKTAFPEQLRKLREKRQMSRKTLGECCGLSKNAIGHYERGTREPNASTILKIANFFGVTADELLRGVSSKSS